MNFEAAMIVFNRPKFFSADEQHAAFKFIVECEKPPDHIQCDFAAIQKQAFVMKVAAFEAIRWEGRWPS